MNSVDLTVMISAPLLNASSLTCSCLSRFKFHELHRERFGRRACTGGALAYRDTSDHSLDTGDLIYSVFHMVPEDDVQISEEGTQFFLQEGGKGTGPIVIIELKRVWG